MKPFIAPTGLSTGINTLHIDHILFDGAFDSKEACESAVADVERGAEAIREWVYAMAKAARHELNADVMPVQAAQIVGDDIEEYLLAAIRAVASELPPEPDDGWGHRRNSANGILHGRAP